MEKQIKNFWIAGFFLPAINATVFRNYSILIGSQSLKEIEDLDQSTKSDKQINECIYQLENYTPCTH